MSARPKEGGDTRAAILGAARAAFAAHGYDKASIRMIAATAGVDPALVYHYFRNKEDVFVAALRFPIRPSTVVDQVMAVPRERAGEAIVGVVTRVWADPQAVAAVVTFLRSLSNEQAAAMLREFFTSAMVEPIAARLGLPDARLRAALVGSQIAGLALLRFVVKLEPLASLPLDRLAAAVTPAVQHYLTGDLTAPLPPPV